MSADDYSKKMRENHQLIKVTQATKKYQNLLTYVTSIFRFYNDRIFVLRKGRILSVDAGLLRPMTDDLEGVMESASHREIANILFYLSPIAKVTQVTHLHISFLVIMAATTRT